MKFKAIIPTLALLALPFLPSKAEAQSTNSLPFKGSLEVLAGDNATTSDLKLSGKFSPKTGFFLRNRVERTYDGKTNPFTLGNLQYNLTPKLKVVADMKSSPKIGNIPRTGIQYSTKKPIGKGELFFTHIQLVDFDRDPVFETHPIIKYERPIGKGKTFFLAGEAINGFKPEGHALTQERVRIGVKIKRGWFWGIGTDIKHAGKEFKTSYNLGGFVGRGF